MNDGAPVLQVEGLSTHFETRRGLLRAVQDLFFSLTRGRCLGIIGESGSGKTVACLSVLGLITYPGRIVAGQIKFQGRDLRRLPAAEIENLRGSAISVVFQDPLTSLNPLFSIGTLLCDVIRRHSPISREQARARAIGLLEMVGISSAADRLDDYPFQLSGGLRQRVSIAMALSCEPALVIADEPTTALDVSIQAQILDLLKDLQAKLGFSIIFVSHDLGLIANLSDDVLIMYAGRCMEYSSAASVFDSPHHPYTAGLLKCAPSLQSQRGVPMPTIEGTLPDLTRLPPGCPFAPRCGRKSGPCEQILPPLVETAPGHLCSCHNPLNR